MKNYEPNLTKSRLVQKNNWKLAFMTFNQLSQSQKQLMYFLIQIKQQGKSESQESFLNQR